MANKQLTASVKLNTSDFERKLKRISRGIDALNKAVGKQSNTYTQVNNALGKVDKATKQVKASTDKWATSQRKVNLNLQSNNSLLGGISSKLKAIASTYLGIMGMKAMIGTSDVLTSTQNKLNTVNNGDTDLTQEQMDKMYASANKVRMAYTDMASNASKSMVLAGEAFNGNMDNAIRFQEIMAETYALGGASAEEMSTSMYQMIQALGAGTLAGDELRSVREGAPLAYKAIEEFAQGVYNSTDSLKDMAAQGLITSDMVVSAVMSAGDRIDEQFEDTAMTFGQAWNKIKNSAVKAFEPVSNMLNKMLNDAANNGAFEKIESAFFNVSKVIQIVFTVIKNAVTWIVDNWSWIQHVVVAGLIILATMWAYQAGVAVASAISTLLAMSAVQVTIMIIVAAVLALVYIFYLWKTGAIDTCQAIVSALLIVGIAVALIGLLLGSWVTVIIGLVIAAIGLIINYLDYFLAALYGFAATVWNVFVTLVTTIIKNAVLPLTQAWDNFANFFGNLFNDPIGAIVHAFEGLADVVLSMLESIAGGIDAIFGSSLTEAVQGWRAGLATKAEELALTWGNGTYEEKSGVTDKLDELLTTVSTDLLWNTEDAWNTGMEHGAIAQEWLAGLGSNLQTGFDFSLDNLGEKLGLNFDNLADGFPNSQNSPLDVDDLFSNVGDIANNTGDVADAMELTQQDLEYLRRIADMEWKKEYTTANINVDMSNYNTVNGESDLDGIVTKLADKLYEEMHVVANGVYV